MEAPATSEATSRRRRRAAKATIKMKSSISFLFVIICTVVLAAQQSQAKKGCNAYGHACYGGHGKRSLGSLVGGGGSASGGDQDDLRPDAILQVFPNEASAIVDGEIDSYPRYRLIKIMKSWFGAHSRRPSERFSEIDYPISGEAFSRDANAFN